MKNYLIVIAGPTASGKTGLAIELAKYFDAEILSCDSRQFFREMSIGTAKPNKEELTEAKHHFINSLSINDTYNIGDYEKDVHHFLANYYKKNKIAIMVGGSGMYIKAVCEGLDIFPEVDKNIRIQLNDIVEKEGILPLQKELENLDPVYYNKIDINNTQRVIRALEICRGTGQPFSSFQGKKKEQEKGFEIIKIGIDWDRPKLYERINLRVDLMLEEGLLAEASMLYRYKHLNALQTVGYQEFFACFDEEISLKKAIELVKRNSRRYAKRQMTWFRKEKDMIWVAAGIATTKVISLLEEKLK